MPKIPDAYAATLRAAPPEATHRVLVVFASPAAVRLPASGRLLTATIAAATLTAAEIHSIAAQASVLAIEPDTEAHTLAP